MNRLRESRIKKGYTQEELAGIIGVDRSTISKWENGDMIPRVEKVILLSELLSIDLRLLVVSIVSGKQ